MMNCEQIQDLLDQYLDGRLEAETVQQVEEHLSHCEECAKLFAVCKDLRKEEGPVPSQFSQSWRAAVRREEKMEKRNANQKGFRNLLVIAAAFVFVIGGTLMTRDKAAPADNNTFALYSTSSTADMANAGGAITGGKYKNNTANILDRKAEIAALNKEIEENMFELIRQKEHSDRWLLRLEVVVGVVTVAILFALCIIASYVPMEDWLRILLIVIGFLPLMIVLPYMLKIEQVAGYYECKHCKHRYVPAFKAINLAPHMGRTRHLRCPECGKKSWHKKVLSKE